MKLLPWLLLPIAGALALYAIAWPDEPIVYRDVTVLPRQIEVREPPARPPTIIERVVYRTVEPVQIATAPLGAQDDVARFCRPTLLATTDTVEVPADPMLLIRSIDYDASLFPWNTDRLFLAGPTSHGDLRALDFRTRGSWDARTHGDSVLVRQGRLPVGGLLDTAAWVAALILAFNTIR